MLKLSACSILITSLLLFKRSYTTLDHRQDDNLYPNETSSSSSTLALLDGNTTATTILRNDDSFTLARELTRSIEERIHTVLAKATTKECKEKIATHFALYLDALGYETSVPFLESHFDNTCPEPVYNFDKLPRGITIEDIMNRTYQPPRDFAQYIEDPQDLRLLYGILSHEHPDSTIRLIEALYEEGHVFVIHVDGKNSSDDTYHTLVEYSKDRPYVHVLPNQYRCRVNWGGFSLVNATYVFSFL